MYVLCEEEFVSAIEKSIDSLVRPSRAIANNIAHLLVVVDLITRLHPFSPANLIGPTFAGKLITARALSLCIDLRKSVCAMI